LEWLKEWAKPALIVTVILFWGSCANSNITQRFDNLDEQLKVVDQRTFEMNSRLSRIEGKLSITADGPTRDTPPEALKK